jgi:release factor glutamine methyltransferase
MSESPETTTEVGFVILEIEQQLDKLLSQKREDIERALAAAIQKEKEAAHKKLDELGKEFDRERGALDAFRQMVKRAAAREPVAYLVGSKEFYSLRFKVTPDVLVPRAETEILVSEAIGHLRCLGRPGRVWDICTGSGCVAVAVAVQAPDAQVLATDVSTAAVAIAAENAAAHGLGERVRCRTADLLTLPEDCADWRDSDVITANPPYVADGEPVAEEVKREPAVALRGGPGDPCGSPCGSPGGCESACRGPCPGFCGPGDADDRCPVLRRTRL